MSAPSVREGSERAIEDQFSVRDYPEMQKQFSSSLEKRFRLLTEKHGSKIRAMIHDQKDGRKEIDICVNGVVEISAFDELCEAIRGRKWANDDKLNLNVRLYHRGGMFGLSDIEIHTIILDKDGCLGFRHQMFFKWEPNDPHSRTSTVDLSDCGDEDLAEIADCLRKICDRYRR